MLTPLSPRNGVRVQNDSGSDIPPYSIAVCTSATRDTVAPYDSNYAYEYQDTHHVAKYTGQAGNILVTGPVTIPSGKLGSAFFDTFTYVSIDQSIVAPKVGEQWGPVPNQWYISRGGMGFFAEGYPASNGDPTKSMFLRDNKGYSIGKFASALSAGSAASPTTATVNTWHPNPASGSSPKPLIQASASGLAGLTVVNYDSSWTAQINYFCEFKREPDGRLTLTSIGCAVS